MSDARTRAESICASLPEPTSARAVELAENVLWMEAKLEDARRVIGKSSVAIPYDNDPEAEASPLDAAKRKRGGA